MDVLRPELLWVNGRCYRKNPELSTDTSMGPVDEAPFIPVPDESGYEEEDFDVTERRNGEFCARLPVPPDFYSYIIGTKGTTRKRLETETHAHIKVPRAGQGADIEVIGSNRSSVLSACRRVMMLSDTMRQRTQFTHFLSFPINSEPVKKAFLQFKNPGKLHLTIGTLVLLDERERSIAAEALQAAMSSVIRPLLEGKGLEIQVKGLEYLNDDPGEVDVLYAKVEPVSHDSNVLQDLADSLVAHFLHSGLMQKQHDRVKLHMTLMNTLFRIEEGAADSGVPGTGRNQRPRVSFDARPILQRFRDRELGRHMIQELHVSVRHSTTPDGYYKASAKVSL
ncbi:unnamed protein product [Darwinula stevensoni]|uniref:K Homology domain-containing protein n=1 Tax=Darwinula stevensoni TaxID=69355 RepID=A0A7R8XBV6_9CRUS|nr:unnamed protein product [Darwinula stevensoni]CAG0891931.1 unnamed protein product [Darwinula stevensoni]